MPSQAIRGFGGFVTFIYLSVIFNGGLESKAGETRTTAMAGPLARIFIFGVDA